MLAASSEKSKAEKPAKTEKAAKAGKKKDNPL